MVLPVNILPLKTKQLEQLWLWVMGVAALVHTGGTLLRWGGSQQSVWLADLHYLIVILLGAISTFTLWYKAIPERRLTLMWACLGMISLALGEAFLVRFEVLGLDIPDYSLADVFYYGYYFNLVLMLLSLLKQHQYSLRSAGMVMDSLVIMFSVGIFAWHGFLNNVFISPESTAILKAVNLSYVAFDLVVIGLALLTLRLHQLFKQISFIVLGLLSYMVADLSYYQLSALDMYVPGNWIDLFWTWGTFAQVVGLAQIYQEAERLPDSRDVPTALAMGLTLFPYIAVLASSGLMLYTSNHEFQTAEQIMWATVVVFILVLLRHALTFLENARLTESLRQSAAQLEENRNLLAHQAYHDSLTGLPNRLSFDEQLRYSLDTPEHLPISVMFIDLDGFKAVNDQLGHDAGDFLLQLVAARFKAAMRQEDLLARLGGDEFMIILRSCGTAEEANRVAKRLITTVEAPFEVFGQQVRVSASIGVALYPEAGTNASLLQQHADMAMYQAKRNGKRQVVIYDTQAKDLLPVPGH